MSECAADTLRGQAFVELPLSAVKRPTKTQRETCAMPLRVHRRSEGVKWAAGPTSAVAGEARRASLLALELRDLEQRECLISDTLG